MGGLFGGGSNINIKGQQLAGVQLQTSAYGMVIPVQYGKSRLPINLIYFTDFTAIPHTTTSSGGGKGGAPSVSNTSYTYTSALAGGLCAGPVTAFGKQWADKDRYSAGAWYAGWVTFTGAYGQTPWAYTTSKHPTEAVPYSGLAYIAHPTYDMGSAATLRTTSVEVTGFSPFNAGTIDDACPAAIVNHMLTDAYEGIGFPSSQMGDYSTAGAFYKYTAAQGLFLSPGYAQQKPTRQHLQDMMQAVNCDFLWSSDQLKVIPYADSNVSGNSYTYIANVTPVYDLTDSDFLPGGGGDLSDTAYPESPIKVTRSATADAWNSVQIEFLDRNQEYNPGIVEAKDQANIEAYGLRTGPPLSMHFIATASIAQLAAQIILQQKLYIRNMYEFRLGWRYALLEPMDLVTLTDANLGLNKTTVRIMKIEEDEWGTLTVTAQEWPFANATPALFSVQTNSGYQPDGQTAPGNANTPVIFEPPLSLTAGVPQIWIATSGGASWGGAEVWVSQDATTYQRIGTIFAGCRHGVVYNANYTGVDPMSVDLTVSGGTLTSASASDAAAYLNLFLVDSEVMSFQTATLVTTSKYNLTTLQRALHGTTQASAHNIGAPWVRLDQSVFQWNTPPNLVGKTLSFKFLSFNTVGGAKQALSGVSAYTYVVVGNGNGAVSKPSSVTIAQVKK